MYLLVHTELSRNDIQGAIYYLLEEKQSIQAVDDLIQDLHQKYSHLMTMPYSRALVQDKLLSDLGYRYIQIKKYFLFYFIEEDTKKVVFTRFLHSRTDWKNILKEDIL